jgi:hypothetical protein
VPNGNRPMTGEQSIRNDLEGSVYGLVDILSRTFLGRNKESHEKPQVKIASVPVEIQTEYLPKTSPVGCRYTSLLVLCASARYMLFI